MSKSVYKAVVLLSLLFSSIAFSAIIGEFGQINSSSYTINLNVKSSNSGHVTVFTEANDALNCLQIVINSTTVRLILAKNGGYSIIAEKKISVPSRKNIPVYIFRSGSNITVIVNGETAISVDSVPAGPGEKVAVQTDNWSVKHKVVNEHDPIFFTDDFMRDYTDDSGVWDIKSGEWHLRSAWDSVAQLLATSRNSTKKISGGQNPFVWTGFGTPAIALVGNEDWQDYTFSVAFRGAEETVFGVILNYKDEDNYLLATISSADILTKERNKISVYKVVNGKKTEVAKKSGGFLPHQWYKLNVDFTCGVLKMLLDDHELLSTANLPFLSGQAGLYIDSSSPVEIDDVNIFSKDIDFYTLFEIESTQRNERYLLDRGGMEVWAQNVGDWQSNFDALKDLKDNQPLYRNYNKEVYGDHLWATFSIIPYNSLRGELIVILNGEKEDKNIGYRLDIKTDGDITKIDILDNGREIASRVFKKTENSGKKSYVIGASGNFLQPMREYNMRFMREGDKLTFNIDGEEVLFAKIKDTSKDIGYTPSFRVSGRYLNATNFKILTMNMYDYTFNEAPTGWFGEGSWEQSTRWSCDPEWSFLAGYSNGDVALWHKDIFSGDQSMQTFMGIKMEYRRQHQILEERYRDMGISICTDGVNVLSGYSAVYGRNRNEMVLYKNGEEIEVITLKGYAVPNDNRHHNYWYDLSLEKSGNKITFTAKIGHGSGSKENIIEYIDDDPIDGGVPVIWSHNNGISVARTRINFSSKPKERPGPFTSVYLPWYPEFASIGSPYEVTLGTSSTSNEEITLTATAVISAEPTILKRSNEDFKEEEDYFDEEWEDELTLPLPEELTEDDMIDTLWDDEVRGYFAADEDMAVGYDESSSVEKVVERRSRTGHYLLEADDNREHSDAESAISFYKNKLLFTPKETGLYEYRIVGESDGKLSPSAHFGVYVFDPLTYTKKTPKPLVKYDMTEGQGNIIHDTSGFLNPLDLRIDTKSAVELDENGDEIPVNENVLSAEWLPGQGLAIDTLTKIVSIDSADKLLILKEDSSMTIEIWASPLSLYPENIGNFHYLASFLELNDPNVKNSGNRWMTVGFEYATFFVSGYTGKDIASGYYSHVNNIRTGLQHIIITFNPNSEETDIYVNGNVIRSPGHRMKSAKKVSWNFDKWLEGAKLILCNALYSEEHRTVLGAPMVGNIYYLAIYNASFSSEDVLNNYKSGPKP